MEFLKKYWLLIVIAVIVIGITLYFVFRQKCTPYTETAVAKLNEYKAQGKLEPWGIGLGGSQWRWDVFCAMFRDGYGYEGCGDWGDPNFWQKMSVNAALSWFKGMNVNPILPAQPAPDPIGAIRIFKEKEILEAIYLYYKTCPQKYWEDVQVGELLNVFPNSTSK